MNIRWTVDPGDIERLAFVADSVLQNPSNIATAIFAGRTTADENAYLS